MLHRHRQFHRSDRSGWLRAALRDVFATGSGVFVGRLAGAAV